MSADYTLTNPLSPSKVHAMLGGDERELLSDQGVQDGEIPLTCSELWTDAVKSQNNLQLNEIILNSNKVPLA